MQSCFQTEMRFLPKVLVYLPQPSHRDIMLAGNVANHRCVQVRIRDMHHINICMKRIILFLYDIITCIFKQTSGGVGGGITGVTAAKWVTTVQVCICKCETMGYFWPWDIYSLLCGDQNWISFTGSQAISSFVCRHTCGCFWRRPWAFQAALVTARTRHISQEVRPSPARFVVTKPGLSSQTMVLS